MHDEHDDDEHDEHEEEMLMDIFNESDTNNDGLLNLSELGHFVEEVNEFEDRIPTLKRLLNITMPTMTAISHGTNSGLLGLPKDTVETMMTMMTMTAMMATAVTSTMLHTTPQPTKHTTIMMSTKKKCSWISSMNQTWTAMDC